MSKRNFGFIRAPLVASPLGARRTEYADLAINEVNQAIVGDGNPIRVV